MFSCGTPEAHEVAGRGEGRSAGAAEDHPHLVDLLPDDLQRVQEAAAAMMAVPCWSSWKTGMSMVSLSVFSMTKHSGALMSSRLMPPTVGSRSWQNRMTSSGILGVDLDVEDVDAGEPLEEDALPLHDRLGRQGPDVPETQHGRPVGHHRHQVAPGGVEEGVVRVLLDLQAGIGHTGAVGQRELPLGGHGLGGHDLDFSRPPSLV